MRPLKLLNYGVYLGSGAAVSSALAEFAALAAAAAADFSRSSSRAVSGAIAEVRRAEKVADVRASP